MRLRKEAPLQLRLQAGSHMVYHKRIDYEDPQEAEAESTTGGVSDNTRGI